MAFQNRRLGVLGNVSEWALWVYRNPEDTIEEIEQDNYFQSVATILGAGDIIYIIAKDTVKQEYICLENGNVKLRELGK